MKTPSIFKVLILAIAASLLSASGNARPVSKKNVYCHTVDFFALIQNSANANTTDEQFDLMADMALNAYKTSLLTEYGLAYSNPDKAMRKFHDEQDARLAKFANWIQLLKDGKLDREEFGFLVYQERDVAAMESAAAGNNPAACGGEESEHGSGRPGIDDQNTSDAEHGNGRGD